ncbi:AMP-binding protein [Rubinisphaera sp.]|uniref:phenylacetate--CoA ligase family protein n=1 Tax=Rubinisphaera sp. TaxID=2024857 RepID=UPI000C0EE5D8|nr:AMP-binding protein [Rubinisphaera sp.]MBV09510.1 CoF synthetase [Rubinisphaera sp.]|tara:strand:+ start:8657 stop:9976 length:1320 start_codon:yes stop_codon:yes gene_type:complete
MTEQILPENLSRDAIIDSQWKQLTGLLKAIETNPFWMKRLSDLDVQPQDINSWEDFRQLKPLTKQELVIDQNENLPYGTNLTYPRSRYTRLHQTSGTTGRPMRFLDTPESWNWFKRCWAQIYRIIGLQENDRFCFPFSFGPFIGFWAGFEGTSQFQNLCIAAGGMSSEVRLQVIQEHEVTIVCCTPTYALRLIEIAERDGIDLVNSSVRAILVAGEPGGSIPAIRNRIEQGWGARVFDHWGMTDIGSLGIESVEDPASLLLLETECIAEIVNPETFEAVTPGERGELLITNLGRWGTPVIRYRTGDIVQAATTPNACGRNLLRLDGGILGRADDMITIRGNNVFPSSVEAVLREFPEIVEYRITVTEKQSMHHLVIEIEPAMIQDLNWSEYTTSPQRQDLLARLSRTVRDRLNFHAEFVTVEPDSLPRFELKGRRFHRA